MTTDDTVDKPHETRAVARFPGVDIAVVHMAAQGGRGESVAVLLQRTPVLQLQPLDPFGTWLQLVQAAWAPWIAVTATLWGLPRIIDRE